MVMMIERSDGGDSEIWGTWEDLLLAFAVCRHGNKDWDSVAKEVRGRTRAPQAAVTPQDCKNRYYGLRRRFEGVVDDEIQGGEQEIGASEIPWMEELRQLRVAELRREVERYDVSIVSLQTKLKNLTEEGERTADEGRPDLDETKEKSCKQTPATHPENAGDLASGNRPGGGSCDESNSPREYRTPGDEGGRVEPEEEPAEKPDLVAGGEKGPGEGSCNGSSDSIAKVRNTAEGEAKASGAPPESMAESMAESKEAAKESSDVQSSASLSKKRRGRRRKAAVSGASSGGDSPEADDVCPLSRRQEWGENKSRPLVGFLEMVRSNKHGSVFDRRLEIQESTRYRSMIRQHMDLDIIRSKLEGGAPPYTTTKFFRDLLLLCINAIVFFSKDSSEHIAATHLRVLVNKEMAATKTNKKPTISPPLSESPMAPPPQPLPRPKPKSESDTENSAPEKRSSTTVPLLACRKGSSISAKAAAAKEEKPVDLEELEHVEKKKREVPVARGLRTTKARAAIKKKTSIDNPNPKPDPGDDSTAEPAKLTMMVAEKKNNSGGNASVDPLASTAKKRSAAGFLDRLKKSTFSSSSNSAPSLQTLKNSGSGGGGRGGSSEQKKGGKGEGKKEQGSARQIGNKQAQEHAPVKRSVGRPPKRPPPAKRARDAERDTSPPPPPSRGSSRKRGKR